MVEKLKNRLIELADSPNLVQDMLTMLTPLRLMMWFTLLNVGLGLVVGIGLLAAASSSNEFSRAAGTMGMGQYIGWLIMMTLGFAMVLFIPLRTSGLIVTPRMSRYMDQVVLSGISPARYFFGRLLGVNVFACGLILVTIPYYIFALSLGGLEFTYVLGSFLALIIFANLLGIFTLAFSLIQYEVLSTLVIVVLASLIYFSGLFPIPPFLASVTPSRLFMIPFFDATGLVENHVAFELAGLSFAINPYLIFVVSNALIIAFLVCCLVIGPLKCIDLPNSTFGEVIMPGDSRRKGIFRRHGQLRRKSELCFLYENSSGWVWAHEIPLRWGRNLLALLVIFLVPLVSCHIFSFEFDAEEFYTIVLVTVLGALGMAGIIFSHDYGTEKRPVRFKGFSMYAGTVSTLCFMVFAAFTICIGFIPPTLRVAVQSSEWLRSSSDVGILFRGLTLIPITALVALEVYSFFRMLLMRRWGYGFPGLMVILLVMVVGVLPLIPCSIFSSLPLVYRTRFPEISFILALISYISPLPHILSMVYWNPGPSDEISRAMYSMRYIGSAITLTVHSGLALIFSVKAYRNHKKLRALNT